MLLMKSLRLYWRSFACLVNMLVCWSCFEITLCLAGRCNHSKIVNRWVPRWSKINLRIFGVKLTAHGALLEHHNPVSGCDSQGRGRIFIANHRSGMDIPITLALVEGRCISRHDVADWPLLGRGAQRVGTLFVDRESRRSGAAVLKEVAHLVENSQGVTMFPEGTSHAGDEVREFHTGAFNAARRSQAQLVPIGIAYGDEAAYYVDDSFLDHVKRLAMLPNLRVAVEIGEPIEFGDSTAIEVTQFAHDRVQELVHRARARLG